MRVAEPAILALDVGGTTIKAALVRRSDLAIVDRSSGPTDRSNVGGGIRRLASELLDRAAAHGVAVEHGAIGVPEYVDGGQVRSTEVIGWTSEEPAELVELVRAASGREIPIVVDSDVRCGARAEARYAADTGQSVLYISWGTGISSTFVLPDGVCWTGANGRAIALGNWPSAAPGFTVEEFASGDGIARRYRALQQPGAFPDSAPHSRAPAHTTLSLSHRAADGDSAAAGFLAEAGRALAAAVLQAVDLLDPHVVIIGGGLGTSDSAAPRAAFARLHADARVSVRRALLGADSGLIGAALATEPFAPQLR